MKNSHLTCAMGDVRWDILWKLSDFIWTIEFTENKIFPWCVYSINKMEWVEKWLYMTCWELLRKNNVLELVWNPPNLCTFSNGNLEWKSILLHLFMACKSFFFNLVPLEIWTFLTPKIINRQSSILEDICLQQEDKGADSTASAIVIHIPKIS